MKAILGVMAAGLALFAAAEGASAQSADSCVSNCLARMRQCGATEECAAEARSCSQRCTGDTAARTFYCRAEGHNAYNDGMCLGDAGDTLEEQRRACVRRFTSQTGGSPSSVTCTPQ
ncbi:hypothetical protein GV829_06780 [Sphingomonas lacunae]|uniref:Uncharacterized protein n=1 Tax=Sphingomonas lacunae TaxID=2698828 RepID=A0A6M4AT28_9SPHN|nr:hypothetical protein [Sphingomonas lacunae]QJQ32195.1 hypothetical protein GV829_06780 [Sphingomonas lacunae]